MKKVLKLLTSSWIWIPAFLLCLAMFLLADTKDQAQKAGEYLGYVIIAFIVTRVVRRTTKPKRK